MSELAPLLAGKDLVRALQTESGDLVLELAGGERGARVRVAAAAGRSCLYGLKGHPPIAATPGAFVTRLASEAAGARLEELVKEPGERIVLFRLRRHGKRFSLLAELLGRSANLLWLDERDRILAWSRNLRSVFRSLRPGEPYVPPPAGIGPDPGSVRPEDLEDLARACGSGKGELGRALGRGIPGLGGLMAREMEHGVRIQRRRLAEVWEELMTRRRQARWDPTLYTPAAIENLEEHTPLETSTCFVAPWPLASASGLSSRAYPGFSEALEDHERLWERWRQLQAARGELAVGVTRERRRLERLIAALRADQNRAAGAEQYRRWGDLLLREKGACRIEAAEAIVTDRYGGGGEERIPIDPARSLRENAEAMFRRYRKAQRAAPQIERRMRAAEERLRRLQPLETQARSAASAREAQALAEGRAIAPRGAAQARTLRAPDGERGPDAQAREYRSSEGWMILVGRGARANDRLTFGIAAPHDFWLHAGGCPGAHVLVRNPRRAPQIPPRTLAEAAALAAWYSKARGSAGVDVHYTQRRHVCRPRGAPPGQVLLKRFRTIRVKPRPPAEG